MNSEFSSRPPSSRRKIAFGLLAVGLLVWLFFYRPAAGRLQNRILRTISAAVGRPVEISSISLRFFPRPGFDLENFVVYDDASFSAEPMLRASEVTALLRVRSLLQGKVEIARLNLTEPSLNLVESGGRWNFESLLLGSGSEDLHRQTLSRGRSSGFPYIEASQGRINFKRGKEKTPYALTDTDFSFWQDSDSSWGVRLRAQPWRSDYSLSDMGILRMEGKWAGNAPLRETRLQLSAQWDGAQLGQISKYVFGSDAGWRGGVTLTASAVGTLAQLELQTGLNVRDFRRFDAPGNTAIRLQTNCKARYGDRAFTEILCSAPVGNGVTTLQGEVSPGMGTANLILSAQEVPVTSLAGLGRSAAWEFANSAPSGRIDGKLRISRSAKSHWQWQGSGEVHDLRVDGAGSREELAVGSIPLAIASESAEKHESGLEHPVRVDAGPLVFASATGQTAAKAPAGGSLMTPLMMRGEFGRHAYSFTAQGAVPARPFMTAVTLAGLWNVPLRAAGTARLDLRAAGRWSDRPKVLGTIHVGDLRIRLTGTSEPIDVASAVVILKSDAVLLQGVKAEAAGTQWTGSMKWPRPCGETCEGQFDVHADIISTDSLNAMFHPNSRTRSWYQFLSSAPGNEPANDGASLLPSLLRWRARGTLKADQAFVHKLQASGVSSDVELKQGKLTLTHLRGTVLGGRHSGEWVADFAANPPSYSGGGTLENGAAEKAGALMTSDWISGAIGGSYEMKMAGWSVAEFLASSDAKAVITLHNGSLSRWTAEQGGIAIDDFRGNLVFHDGNFQLSNGEMQAGDFTYSVAGTASWGQSMHLQFAREGAPTIIVTGTMASPKISVTTGGEASAQLKP